MNQGSALGFWVQGLGFSKWSSDLKKPKPHHGSFLSPYENFIAFLGFLFWVFIIF